MEVCHQPIDGAEPVAGGDEDRGVAGKGLDDAIIAGRAFEQAQAGGADRDHPPAARAHRIEPGSRCGFDPAPFGVHRMGCSVFHFHRQEGACADMQREHFMTHSRLGERRHQSGCEMERGGWRGNCAVFGREHCLVIAPILLICPALLGDIGRKRHGSGAFQQHFDRLIARKGQRPAAIWMAGFGNRGHLGGKCDHIANVQAFTVADKGLPPAQVDPLVERRADPGLTAPALKLGGYDAGIVEHQDIAGL